MDEESEEFAKERKRLWDELVHLNDAWDEYLYLFGDKERVELLNRSGRWFFGLVQRVLIREVLLSVSRLTDNARMGRRANLTLDILLSDPRIADIPGLTEELAAAIADVRSQAEPIRVHRNRTIAHLDHATAIGSADDPLPSVPRDLVTAVVLKMGEVYNLHGGKTRESHASFELQPLGGPNYLMRVLEDGHRWRDAERARRNQQLGGGSDPSAA